MPRQFFRWSLLFVFLFAPHGNVTRFTLFRQKMVGACSVVCCAVPGVVFVAVSMVKDAGNEVDASSKHTHTNGENAGLRAARTTSVCWQKEKKAKYGGESKTAKHANRKAHKHELGEQTEILEE